MAERLLPLEPLTIQHQINFWLKVNKTNDCWLWLGRPNKQGYGTFWYNSKRYIASRVSYFLLKEDPKSMYVCHSCNNTCCVNPEHLYLGTQQENIQQCHDEGRHNIKGELHYGHKLTERDVLEIRASRLPQAELARKYKVSPSVIYQVIRRKIWSHI